MGSYDSAETCEVLGCYLLSQLNEIPGIEIGLYRDNGLAVLLQTPKATERIKKEICKIPSKQTKKSQLPGRYLGSEHGEIHAILQTIKHPALCA